jgi:predicted nucleic acid-binding protein
MIILDTNVISEMMKPEPSGPVFNWMSSQPEALLYTTSITLGEVLFGLELLPLGRRRTALARATEIMFERTLEGRILDFDEHAARAYAGIMAKRTRAGKSGHELDSQIAAIASSRRAAVATRNTKDFADCGVKLIDPWAYSN